MEVNEQLLTSFTQGAPCMNFYLSDLNAENNLGGLHRHNFFQLILLMEGTIEHTIDFEQCIQMRRI